MCYLRCMIMEVWFRSYLDGLVVFPAFFSLSLNFAIRSWRSEPQSAPGLVFAEWIGLHFRLQRIKSVWHLVMSTCKVIPCVVGKRCLLWPVWTLLAFVLLHFVLQGQICLLLQVSLHLLLLHSNPLWLTGHLFLVLVLEGLIGLHRTG